MRSPGFAFVAVALLALAASSFADEEGPAAAPTRARVRLELWARSGPPIGGKVKLGREGSATGWTLAHDARRQATPTWGYGAELDLEVLDWASVGLSAWEVTQPSGRRRIHYEGIDLDGRAFPGDTRLTTRLELSFVELSLRYVWRNERDLRLWFGIGPAWTSTRLTLRGDRQRATTRWADVLGPSLSYGLWARIGERWEVFLLSGIAFVPHRLPSLTTRFRLGLGRELFPGVSLRVAGSLRNAFLGSWRDQVSKDPRVGHDWRRIRWSSLGVEFGLAFTL